jgi:hypothetical protein
MAGKRMLITISEQEKQWLGQYSKACNISIAEAIRQGIACLRESQSQAMYQDAVRETTGIWSQGDGLTYQQNLRREWGS